MSVGWASILGRVVAIRFPITVSGICPRSGSSASATGAHTGKLSDAPHFIGHENYTWSKLVPDFYSVETIWADSGIHALEEFDYGHILNKKGLKYLYSVLWRKYPQYRENIVNYAKDNSISCLYVKFESKLISIFQSFKKIISRAVRKKDDVKKYFDVEDISVAVDITQKVMKENDVLKSCNFTLFTEGGILPRDCIYDCLS